MRPAASGTDYTLDCDEPHTLRTSVIRLDELRLREALGPLDRADALELLALVEVVVRKAAQGRQSTVRAARASGASWADIGRATGTTKQSAWEAHNRWIADQLHMHEDTGYEGLDEAEAARARQIAGEAPPS